MEHALISPALASIAGIPVKFFGIIIPIIGILIFAHIINKRLMPLKLSASDPRMDRIGLRINSLFKIWLAQYRQPRYMLAGVLHILIFAGFLIISLQSITLVILGFKDNFVLPGLSGPLGIVYFSLKDIAATLVLISCIIAAIRRGIFKPARYAVPAKYGHDHTGEAVFVLCIISILMISESLFEASLAAAQIGMGAHAEFMVTGSLVWFETLSLKGASVGTLQGIHIVSYIVHDCVFFFFLCFLPLGKHFHVITSIFNVFFAKLDKGTVKPVKWGISDEELDNLESFGVKRFTDFTWKHMLDFYTCADCGRCSDRCPANRVKRPLSPRFISIKCRDLAFRNYPILGTPQTNDKMLFEDILSEDEIWSCTTCGACEAECPLLIEYIDKIVDLRRGMVDEGLVPQSLQKPLSALEKRGNPYGKLEKKRSEWAENKEFAEECEVKILDKKGKEADVLYFVDSITSFDDRMQNIARATARVLSKAGADFGILGKNEKDSGNEVRRFGEEMLFQDLKNQNIDAILETGATTIVTADPHAFNALKNDYKELSNVEHISMFINRKIKSGELKLKPLEDTDKVYTYHDPCYLGRHNGIYDIPRQVLDAVPNLRRVEMKENCRDRSFCCGGGGLMLFYEPEEEQRMGAIRVQMAKEAGADVIVTACPFCMVNMEDAIKTSGLEGQMEAIDLVELIDRQTA